MKRKKLVKWCGLVILVLIGGFYLFRFLLALIIFSPAKSPERTSEEIFSFRVLDGQPVPTEVTKIQAVEGPIAFGYSNGEAFVRFEATDSFIEELIENDHGIYGAYSPVSCNNSPIMTNRGKIPFKAFKWWKPTEATSPACYATSTCILYDEKFLLIDPDNNVGYFYRTAICGLCPSGLEGQALRESPRCQQ